MKKALFTLLMMCGMLVSAQIQFRPFPMSFGDTAVYPMVDTLYFVDSQRFIDLDGDGDQDVIARGLRKGGGSLRHYWVLENTNTQSMKLKPDSLFLATSNPILSADFDQNGTMDFMFVGTFPTLSPETSSVLFLNQGNFNFSRDTISILDSIQVNRAFVLDANNDSYPDVLIDGKKRYAPFTNRRSVFILLNDSTGSFIGARYEVGMFIGGDFGVIDGNADGLDDLMMTGWDTAMNRSHVYFENLGNGSFSSYMYDSTAQMSGSSFYTGDFNNDGHVDFAVSHYGGITPLNLYLNNAPSPGFTRDFTTMGMGWAGFNSHRPMFLDRDSDGDLELLDYMQSGAPPVFVHYSQDTAGNYVVDTTDLGDVTTTVDMDTADINGDGFVDIYNSRGAEVFYNNQQGVFTAPLFHRVLRSRVENIEVTDFNGDGLEDLLISTGEPNTSGVYINQGGSFKRMDIPFFDSEFIKSIHVIDIDGDGDKDFVGMYWKFYVLENQGGTFVDKPLGFTRQGKVFIMNYDNQHQLDVMVVDKEGTSNSVQKVYIYATDATGGLNLQTTTGLAKPSSSTSVAVGDQDRDGLDDIYIGDPAQYSLPYGTFINNGNGSFSAQYAYTNSLYNSSGTENMFIDFSGDSTLELVTNAMDSLSGVIRLGFMEFNSSGRYKRFSDPDLVYTPTFGIADFDGDTAMEGVGFDRDNKRFYSFTRMPSGDIVTSQIKPAPYSRAMIRVLDFDGDGDEDFLAVGAYGSINGEWGSTFFENISNCSSTTIIDSVVTCNVSPTTWRDGNTYYSDTSGVFFTEVDSNNCFQEYELVFKQVRLTGGVNYVGLASLEAVDSGFAYNYQWVNCSNSTVPIPGATQRRYTPTVNGNYSVKVWRGDCFRYSACYTIDNVGVDENSAPEFEMYPNPASDELRIDLTADEDFNQVNIYSLQGVRVLSESISGSVTLGVQHLPPGVYTVELVGEKGARLKKLVVE